MLRDVFGEGREEAEDREVGLAKRRRAELLEDVLRRLTGGDERVEVRLRVKTRDPVGTRPIIDATYSAFVPRLK